MYNRIWLSWTAIVRFFRYFENLFSWYQFSILFIPDNSNISNIKSPDPSSSKQQGSIDYICRYLQYLYFLRYSRGNCCQIYCCSFYRILAYIYCRNSNHLQNYNADRSWTACGLISLIRLFPKSLEKKAKFLISILKWIILNNIYIGWFCMKIMLEADKCIYVLWREIILLSINSRNNYIEHGIKKIMEFSIDTIYVVFVETMLQQTMHNRKYNWNNQRVHHYLSIMAMSFFPHIWLISRFTE